MPELAESFRFADAARVYFQTRTAFWREDPLGVLGGLKMIGTDTLAERIWNTSPGQPGPEHMLHAYLFGDHAEVLATVPDQERVNRIRSEISRFLPGLDSQIVASYAKVWREDPFAGGASRSLNPANYAGFSQPLAAPITGCTSPVSTSPCQRAGWTVHWSPANASPLKSLQGSEHPTVAGERQDPDRAAFGAPRKPRLASAGLPQPSSPTAFSGLSGLTCAAFGTLSPLNAVLRCDVGGRDGPPATIVYGDDDA